MSYRLWTIFYVFALVAAAMATFGAWGIAWALLVLVCLHYVSNSRHPYRSFNWILTTLFLVAAGIIVLPPWARRTTHWISCMDNLKQIQLALMYYHDAKRSLPPAYIADANGKPMHSWRVLILPYLGQTALYNKYNFNEPWDGPNNSKLASQIVDVYRCPGNDDRPSQPGETHYFAVVGAETAWPGPRGRRIREFTDGTSRSLTVIEATGLGVNWMEPRDLSVDEAVDLLTKKPRSGHSHSEDGFLTTTYFDVARRNVVYCDEHVETLGQLRKTHDAKSLLTVAGGEKLPWELREVENGFVEPKRRTVIKWDKVWGLAVCIVLAVLPAWWLRQLTPKQATMEQRSNAPPSTAAVAGSEIILVAAARDA